jgi:dipeptidyl aminopeptidase/acylaminoacyl peptidase
MVICDRGYQGYRLLEVLAADGATRTIAVEESDDGIAPRGINWQSTDGLPDLVVSGGGRDVIWWSLRDGWPHLYLYDGETGAVRRQLTSGAWSVQDVLHVDEAARRVVFTGSGREAGRDPYLRAVYSVSLDGGDPELITHDELDHQAWVSPTGTFLVDTASRWDQPPTTVVRETSGPVVCPVEQGDASRLLATGWQPPDRMCVKGRDGQTDVYGLLFRPSASDRRPLPVVDFIYGGPQMNQAGASFADSARAAQADGVSSSFWHAQAIAELGFAVVMIDGLGMPGRSRDFQAVAWRNLADAGIPDHVAAYPQLGEQYPDLDIERIGIFGHSAGGYASAQAILRYPDVYKVCVSSAGNHDHRLDKAVWVERYMGLPVGDHYAEQANRRLAGRLRGKLLLAHGDMDENVPLAGTLSLVDALIEANKDFDLLVLPNRSHRFADDPYFTRIRWDYFVRHLRGENPPAYRIKAPARTAPS